MARKRAVASLATFLACSLSLLAAKALRYMFEYTLLALTCSGGFTAPGGMAGTAASPPGAALTDLSGSWHLGDIRTFFAFAFCFCEKSWAPFLLRAGLPQVVGGGLLQAVACPTGSACLVALRFAVALALAAFFEPCSFASVSEVLRFFRPRCSPCSANTGGSALDTMCWMSGRYFGSSGRGYRVSCVPTFWSASGGGSVASDSGGCCLVSVSGASGSGCLGLRVFVREAELFAEGLKASGWSAATTWSGSFTSGLFNFLGEEGSGLPSTGC